MHHIYYGMREGHYQTVQNGKKGKRKKDRIVCFSFLLFSFDIHHYYTYPRKNISSRLFFKSRKCSVYHIRLGCSWITWRWSRWITWWGSRWITWRGSHPFGERIKTFPVKWPIYIIVSRKSTLLTFLKICLCFFLGSAYVRNHLKNKIDVITCMLCLWGENVFWRWESTQSNFPNSNNIKKNK